MLALTEQTGNAGALVDFYRCPSLIPKFRSTATASRSPGYFRVGSDLICYGRLDGLVRPTANGELLDAFRFVESGPDEIWLPFDPADVMDGLRYERYTGNQGRQRWVHAPWVARAYYALRPLLPVSVRKHLQRYYVRDWDKIAFPAWPLDRTLDCLQERLMLLAIEALSVDRLPFIWFWPKGHKACLIMTHDVESAAGRDFSGPLMEIDDAYGIKAAFQIVPEDRYEVPPAYLDSIRERGFEINVQGLDHVGNLFGEREAFLRAASRINDYATQFGARGFRSPALYRKADWFQDLNFAYDMSFPTVACLEAQRGGCCTLMPYFLPGGMLELPLTTTEDYTLFHILDDYSGHTWNAQTNTILEANGLLSFLIHPDYLLQERAISAYRRLLDGIAATCSSGRVWVTLPGEVETWWRQRSAMSLVEDVDGLRIEGDGADFARIAFACVDDGKIVYEVPTD